MSNQADQKPQLGEILSFVVLATVGGALLFHFLGKGAQEIPSYVKVIGVLSFMVGFMIAMSKKDWTGFYLGMALYVFAAVTLGLGAEINPSAVGKLADTGDPTDFTTRVGKSLYFCATRVCPLFGSFIMIAFPYIDKK